MALLILRVAVNLIQTIQHLPAPSNLFLGATPQLATLPTNIVPFVRTSANEAFDGGPHMHSRFVLCYCLNGGASLAIDHDVITLTPGQAVLLYPFEKHQFHQFSQPDILWLFIGFDLPECPAFNFLRHYRCSITPAMDQQLADLIHHAQLGNHGDPSAAIYASASLLELLAILNVTAKNQPQSSDLQSGHPIVRGVLREIHADGGMGLDISSLAAKLNISEVHLRRTFRSITGISLGVFLRGSRIKLAQSLLRQENLRISEIADRCGFNNLFSFSRAFTRDVGMSAQEYRKQILS